MNQSVAALAHLLPGVLLTVGAHGAVVAAGGHDHLSLHDVGVHAGLGVVVQGHQGPVGNNAANVLATADNGLLLVLTHDQVLHGGGVEQLDVGCLRSRGAEGAARRTFAWNVPMEGTSCAMEKN